jgi:WD40 repeat protein
MKTSFMHLAMIFMLIVLAAACGKGGADEKALTRVYSDYHKAIREGDTRALKEFVNSEKQKEITGEGAAVKLQVIKEFLPTEIEVTGASTSGSTARLEVKGKKQGQEMTGTVNFVKEDGQWKIDKEEWQMSFETPGMTDEALPFMKAPTKPPQVHLVLAGHQGEVTDLAFTPDSRYLVSASYGDYSNRVWDTRTGQEISYAGTADRVRCMALSRDGRQVITADADNNIISLPLDFGTLGTPETLFRNVGDAAAVSPDGKFIAVTGWRLPVQLWDPETKQLIETICDKTDRRVLTFSVSGKILAGGGNGNNYSIWSAGKWKERRYKIGKIDADSEMTAMDISGDENYLATGHNESSIVIFSLKERRELHNFFVRDAATHDVKFSPDSKILATAHQDKKIYLWDVETAGMLAVLAQHTDVVRSLAFSPDGTALASGGEDRKIFIWRTGPPAAPVPAAPDTRDEDISFPGTTGVETVDLQGQQNLVKNPDAGRAAPSWETKGEVSIDTGDPGNHLFIIRYGGMFRQDVPIGESTGRYVLLIAWASSERVNPGDDQTGYPYLYGYFLDSADKNKINAYLKGEQMLLSPNTADEWGLIYGIFQVPENTGSVRFFLQQADGRSPQDGSAARFDQPGVFLFDSEAEAIQFVDKY